MSIHAKRPLTGNHLLLPAVRPNGPLSFSQVHQIPTYTQVFAWTFGRASIVRLDCLLYSTSLVSHAQIED